MDELGQKLRQARIDKGYTIDDLQQITKIQKRYLLAIEEGKLDQLPGKFYVNAFIKQYAQTVGLDGQALLNQYQGKTTETQTNPQTDESSSSETEDTEEAKDTASPKPTSHLVNESGPSWFDRIRGYLPQIIIIVIVLVLIVGIYGIALSHRNSNKQTVNEPKSSVSVKDERKASSKSSRKVSSVSKSSSSAKSSSNKATTLSIKAGTKTTAGQTFTISNLPAANNTLNISATSASTWITVTASGTTLWQGSVTAAAPHSVQLPTGIASFVVTSGNAPVTQMKINDTSVKLAESSTKVQNYTFNIQGAQGATTSNTQSTQTTGNSQTTGTNQGTTTQGTGTTVQGTQSTQQTQGTTTGQGTGTQQSTTNQ